MFSVREGQAPGTNCPTSASALVDAERHQIPTELNPAPTAVPPALFHELVERWAERFPRAIAVQSNARTVDYAELKARASRLAAHLQSCGVQRGSIVGICMPRSIGLVEAILSVLKAGGAYLPIDPEVPLQRIRFMLQDCGAVRLILNDQIRPLLSDLNVPLTSLEGDDPLWSGSALDLVPVARSDNDLAYVIYTSGSTGRPKGVKLLQGGLRNLVHVYGDRWGIDHDSRVLQFASPSFDAATCDIACALGRGAVLVIPSKAEIAPGESLADALLAYGITHTVLPPAALAVTPSAGLTDLQVVGTAGEACPPAAGRLHTLY